MREIFSVAEFPLYLITSDGEVLENHVIRKGVPPPALATFDAESNVLVDIIEASCLAFSYICVYKTNLI